MVKIDVTKDVEIGSVDDECLPMTKCICGQEFDHWKFILSIYEDNPAICPTCGRKFYFENRLRIYEIKEAL